MSQINWNIRYCLDKLSKEHRLTILIALLSHCNLRLRCWPTVEGLAKTTDLSTATVNKAKKQLQEWQAFYYVPYEKRIGDEEKLPPVQKVYQLTGILNIDGEIYEYLYLSPESKEELNILLSKILENKILNSKNKVDTIKEDHDKKKEPLPRKRDAIFDIVAICLFNADLENLHRSEAGRIAKVSNAFKEKYPNITPEHIAIWCEWHKANKGYDLPLDPAKVLKHYGDWLKGEPIDLSQLPHDYDPDCPKCHGTGSTPGETYCKCYAPLLSDVIEIVGDETIAQELLKAYKKRT